MIEMKFALVNGHSEEAQPGLSGECRGCGRPTIAKCGEVRIWHWAHQTKCVCDVWWENEGQWHRFWKNHFPVSWQEVVHPAENGLRHIADIKTELGWVIEFQHSYITPDERRSRDAFYKKLVWVVDATRRKNDAAQFNKALEVSTPVAGNQYIRRLRPGESRLIKEWSGSPGPIFFDFGVDQTLCWLLAVRPEEPAYIGLFRRIDFIESHLGKGPPIARDFDQFVKTYNELTSLNESMLRSAALRQVAPKATAFQQYLAARNRSRRRF